MHKGHLAAAQEVYKQFRLDEVWFMPAPFPPHKTGRVITEISFRLDMLKIAIGKINYFKCSDFELGIKGKSYTCETVLKLREEYSKTAFSLIIGTDSLFEIETWKNPDIIMKNCRLLAVARDYEHSISDMRRQADLLQAKYGAKIALVEYIPFELSSTHIRKLLAEKGNAEKYLDKEVLDYIYRHGLYQSLK